MSREEVMEALLGIRDKSTIKSNSGLMNMRLRIGLAAMKEEVKIDDWAKVNEQVADIRTKNGLKSRGITS